MHADSFRPYVWMLQASFAFTLMAAFTHKLGPWCDWQLIAIVRSFVALFVTALVARLAGESVLVWRSGSLWVRSLAGSCSMVCTFYALTRLPVSDVLTLTNMFPIWVALLSWPMLGEVPPRGVWFSVLSGVIGVALIQQPHLEQGNLAVVAAASASLFTAAAMLGLHRIRGIPLRAIVVHFSAVALCFCVVAFFLFDRPPPVQTVSLWLVSALLLGVGLTATVGQWYLTRAFAAGNPARVAVVGLTQIVFALILDVTLLEHPMHPQGLLGMALILAPTAWLMTRPRKSKEERE